MLTSVTGSWEWFCVRVLRGAVTVPCIDIIPWLPETGSENERVSGPAPGALAGLLPQAVFARA